MHSPPPSTLYSANMVYVSQLIDQDLKQWNMNTLFTLFDRDTVEKIEKNRIPFNGKDKLRWEPSNNGQFTVKSAYRVILQEQLTTKPSNNNMSINWK